MKRFTKAKLPDDEERKKYLFLYGADNRLGSLFLFLRANLENGKSLICRAYGCDVDNWLNSEMKIGVRKWLSIGLVKVTYA
ncbi:hypothetical protein GCM10020331_056580 [Ectobacillus funiculus]